MVDFVLNLHSYLFSFKLKKQTKKQRLDLSQDFDGIFIPSFYYMESSKKKDRFFFLFHNSKPTIVSGSDIVIFALKYFLVGMEKLSQKRVGSLFLVTLFWQDVSTHSIYYL